MAPAHKDNCKCWNIFDCSGYYTQSNKFHHIKAKKHQLFLK